MGSQELLSTPTRSWPASGCPATTTTGRGWGATCRGGWGGRGEGSPRKTDFITPSCRGGPPPALLHLSCHLLPQVHLWRRPVHRLDRRRDPGDRGGPEVLGVQDDGEGGESAVSLSPGTVHTCCLVSGGVLPASGLSGTQVSLTSLSPTPGPRLETSTQRGARESRTTSSSSSAESPQPPVGRISSSDL